MTAHKDDVALPINRIISISWKLGICPQEAAANGWQIDGSMSGFRYLTLYCNHSRHGTVIHFWKYAWKPDGEHNGKFMQQTYTMLQRNLFDEPWKYPHSNFAGSLQTARDVLGLAIPDLYPAKKLARNQRLEEEKCDYVIDALHISQHLQAFPNEALVVRSSIFEGNLCLTLASVKKLHFGQIETFDPLEDLERIRMVYQVDEHLLPCQQLPQVTLSQ